MVRRSGSLALALLAGCSAAAGVGGRTGPEPPAPPPGRSTWAIVGAPVARATVVEPCHTAPDAFHFEVRDGVVELYRSFAGTPSGVPHAPEHERAQGRWSRGVLRLRGEHLPAQRGHPVAGQWGSLVYELRLEAASGNLVGTRGGVPIRLAPADVVPRDRCGPPPP